MSYLNLEKGIEDFSRAVISFWFRVPKASLDAAYADSSSPPLFRQIPLLTFGKPQNTSGGGPIVSDACSGDPVIFETTSFGPSGNTVDDLDPCYIGIDCNMPPRLVFNIQMDSFATGTNAYGGAVMSSAVVSRGLVPVMSPDEQQRYIQLANTPGSGVFPYAHHPPGSSTPFLDSFFITVNRVTDYTTDFYSQWPESFYVNPPIEIEPDKWHHLLLSFDVSKPINVTGASGERQQFPYGTFANYWPNIASGVSGHAMMWYAYDDKDYRGRMTPEEFEKFVSSDPHSGFGHRLGPYSVDYGQQTEFIPGVSTPGQETMDAPEGGDPNGILTERSHQVGTSSSGDGLYRNFPVGSPTYSYTPEPIPTKDAEIGLPASTKWVEHVHRVEMAEFQLFTGVTLDTAEEKNRRAFVDKDGKPVPPDQKKQQDADGKTIKESGSIELLGKRPDILLHKSDNWKKGKNTGTTGVVIEIDTDGTQKLTEIPAGQFTPIAKIEPYKPDPSLIPIV